MYNNLGNKANLSRGKLVRKDKVPSPGLSESENAEIESHDSREWNSDMFKSKRSY